MNRNWEKVDIRLISENTMGYLGGGLFGPPEPYWEVTYKHTESGKEVRGWGYTPEEADKNALSKIW